MCVPYRLRDPKTRRMRVIGNFSLVVALLVWALPRRFAAGHPNAHAWIDAICGLFFGISIGSNLMAAWRSRRCRPIEPLNRSNP
jgi:hypothetical protein